MANAKGSMNTTDRMPDDDCCWATSIPRRNRTASQRGTERLRQRAIAMRTGATKLRPSQEALLMQPPVPAHIARSVWRSQVRPI